PSSQLAIGPSGKIEASSQSSSPSHAIGLSPEAHVPGALPPAPEPVVADTEPLLPVDDAAPAPPEPVLTVDDDAAPPDSPATFSAFGRAQAPRESASTTRATRSGLIFRACPSCAHLPSAWPPEASSERPMAWAPAAASPLGGRACRIRSAGVARWQ